MAVQALACHLNLISYMAFSSNVDYVSNKTLRYSSTNHFMAFLVDSFRESVLMKDKGGTISKAHFIFKCHVEIGQGRESTEKGNYNGKEAQSNVQEDAPPGMIYVNMTPIPDTEADSQVYKQAAQ